MKLRSSSSKSNPHSPVANKKEQERALSDTIRNIQRKELKLKELKLMNSRYDARTSVEVPSNQYNTE